MGLNLGSLAGSTISSVPGVGTVYGAADSIVKSLESHPKDAGRLAANATAYRLALAGNSDALDYLHARSGQAGTLNIGAIAGLSDTPAALSGWATSTTRDDAAAKYNQVLAAARAGGGGAATAAGPSGATPATDAFGTALTASTVGGLPMWALLGLVAGAAYFLIAPPGSARRGR